MLASKSRISISISRLRIHDVTLTFNAFTSFWMGTSATTMALTIIPILTSPVLMPVLQRMRLVVPFSVSYPK